MTYECKIFDLPPQFDVIAVGTVFLGGDNTDKQNTNRGLDSPAVLADRSHLECRWILGGPVETFRPNQIYPGVGKQSLLTYSSGSRLTVSPLSPLLPFWPDSPCSPWGTNTTCVTTAQTLSLSLSADSQTHARFHLIPVVSGRPSGARGPEHPHGTLVSVLTRGSHRALLSLEHRRIQQPLFHIRAKYTAGKNQ